ncbi:ABC transporter permease [Patescibacteria group bacterium]
MKKYWTLIKITWQRALTYRFSVFAYRIGEISEMLIVIFMWTAIFDGQNIIKGYTLPEMITYILIGNLVNAFVRNWLTVVVAGDIKNGTLSQFLVRPIKYFNYIIFREIGRISLSLLASVFSQIIVVLVFLNIFILNTHPITILLIGAMVILAFVIEMLLSYLIGLIAFWTDEVDGIYTTIGRLKKFFSGGYFPISLLPITFVNISFMLPFAYSFFIPAQLYLNKISIATGLKGLVIQIIWIFLLYGIIHVVWKKGLKRYEGVGI